MQKFICAALFLTAFSISCTTKIPAPPEVEYLTPPEVLIQNCPGATIKGKTTGDLVSYNLDLKAALQQCNIDKQKIREWATQAKGEN